MADKERLGGLFIGAGVLDNLRSTSLGSYMTLRVLLSIFFSSMPITSGHLLTPRFTLFGFCI